MIYINIFIKNDLKKYKNHIFNIDLDFKLPDKLEKHNI